jgi:hypothetical protein
MQVGHMLVISFIFFERIVFSLFDCLIELNIKLPCLFIFLNLFIKRREKSNLCDRVVAARIFELDEQGREERTR